MTAISIKICGVNTPDALEAALRARASHVGLVFHPKSPRHVSLELAERLSLQAQGRAKVVGLFVDPDPAAIEQVRQKVTLQAIQLHGRETPAKVAQIRARSGIEVWKALPVKDAQDLSLHRKFLGAADRVLFDAKPPEGSELPGGSGLRFDWSLLQDFKPSLPWVLAGGLDPRNVGAAIRMTSASFVDVSSGVETAPGVKDAGLIAAFCDAAREA